MRQNRGKTFDLQAESCISHDINQARAGFRVEPSPRMSLPGDQGEPFRDKLLESVHGITGEAYS